MISRSLTIHLLFAYYLFTFQYVLLVLNNECRGVLVDIKKNVSIRCSGFLLNVLLYKVSIELFSFNWWKSEVPNNLSRPTTYVDAVCRDMK